MCEVLGVKVNLVVILKNKWLLICLQIWNKILRNVVPFSSFFFFLQITMKQMLNGGLH